MGHGRHVTGSSYETPAAPAPVADYNVATNPELVPDCSCNYFAAGTHNAQPYYRRADGAYFIFADGYGYWIICNELNDEWVNVWNRDFEDGIAGEYLHLGTYAGTATVSAGPH